jgi:uncharacterized membrane-anchored protein YhcB (DUF1043 family)
MHTEALSPAPRCTSLDEHETRPCECRRQYERVDMQRSEVVTHFNTCRADLVDKCNNNVSARFT